MWRRLALGSLLLAAARTAPAQPYDVSWWTVDGGGAMGIAGSPYAVSGTIGQPDAGGPFAAGAYSLSGGFWTLTAAGGAGGNADLAVTVTDAPDPVASGGTLTYTIALANLGPATSSGMTVTSALPPGVAFLSSTPGLPLCTPGSTVTCTLGALSPGTSHTVTIRVGIPSSMLGPIALTSTVAGNETDPATANNNRTEATLVVPRARGELAHGTTVHGDLGGGGPVADVDLFRIRQQPYASYEVVVDATSGDVGLGAGPLVQRVGADGFTPLQASQPVGAGPSRSLRWENTVPGPVDDQFVRIASASCATNCGPDDAYRVRTYETTCVIPRFNNSSSQITVILVQNAGTSAVSGRLSFWSAAGSLLHTEPVSLAPRGLVSLNASGVAALQGASGSVTISSDAAYGTLVGKAVALEPATGYSFDSPLEARRR